MTKETPTPDEELALVDDDEERKTNTPHEELALVDEEVELMAK